MIKAEKLRLYNQALDSIRPFLIEDGGNVSVIDFDSNGIVKIQLKGNCVGCNQKAITIKTGIESILKQKFEEVSGVEEILINE